MESKVLPIKYKTNNNNKHVFCQLHSVQLQKEVKSNPKQPSYKKVCGPQDCYCEKICEIQSDGRLSAKILITAIWYHIVVKYGEDNTN